MVGFGDEEKTEDPHGFGEAFGELTIGGLQSWMLLRSKTIREAYAGSLSEEELLRLLGASFYAGISTIFARCPQALSAWMSYQYVEMGVDPETVKNMPSVSPPEKNPLESDLDAINKTAGWLSKAYDALGSLRTAGSDLDVEFHVNDARKLLGALQQRVAILEDSVKDLGSKQ